MHVVYGYHGWVRSPYDVTNLNIKKIPSCQGGVPEGWGGLLFPVFFTKNHVLSRNSYEKANHPVSFAATPP